MAKLKFNANASCYDLMEAFLIQVFVDGVWRNHYLPGTSPKDARDRLLRFNPHYVSAEEIKTIPKHSRWPGFWKGLVK